VTGLDFSSKAIAAARQLARETGVDANFVEGNVYDAPALLSPGEWDIVFTTWGTVTWLPDIARWADVVAQMLRPGGRLYFLDAHPVTSALQQAEPGAPIQPTYDYFHGSVPLEFEEDGSYADAQSSFTHTRSHEWIHPLSAILTGLIEAGMRIDVVREHDAIAWQLFPSMSRGEDGLWRLPVGVPRIPLAVTVEAEKLIC
jgi:SAM-dependent methyltransferase